MIKQTTNKCKCESVFCDKHKFPIPTSTEQLINDAKSEPTSSVSNGSAGADAKGGHQCDYNFVGKGREILSKTVVKNTEQRAAGTNFKRI